MSAPVSLSHIGAMNVLALDSSMAGICIGVYTARGGLVTGRQAEMERGQAEALIPMAQKTMAAAGLSFADLDAIVSTIGPGSFTGLRLGLSSAKSFGLALGKPVYGVGTLEALAQSRILSEDKIGEKGFAVITETRRDDFYFQHFDPSGRPLSEAQALSLAGLTEMLSRCDVADVIGDSGLEKFITSLDKNEKAHYSALVQFIPDPVGLITVFDQYYQNNKDDFGRKNELEPLYLREADVSTPKNLPRQLSS